MTNSGSDNVEHLIREIEKEQDSRHNANQVRLTKIEEKLEEMYNRLFGNGQPGLIRELKEEDKNLLLKLSDLEKQVIKIVSVSAGIWLALTGGHIAVEHFLK